MDAGESERMEDRGDSRYWSSGAFPRTESIIGGREPLVSWHGDRISRLLSVVGTLLDTSAIVYPRVSPFLPHRGNADLAADRGRGAR
jgi:hypothetical protein